MPTRSRTCPSAGRAEYCLTLLHVFLLAALLAGCDILGDDASSDDKAFDAAFEQQLESTVNTLFESLEVPGALVGVWIPEKGSWTTSLGVANLETGEPSAFENHVRIGSITKTFTVTMILQLAEQGSLDLEDPISKYFDTDPASGKITLSQPPAVRGSTPRLTSSLTGTCGGFKRKAASISPHLPHLINPGDIVLKPGRGRSPALLVDEVDESACD